MEKIPTAEEILKYNESQAHLNQDSDYRVKSMIEFARLQVIAELKKHIEHPSKPGYKRSDIVARIKELENIK